MEGNAQVLAGLAECDGGGSLHCVLSHHDDGTEAVVAAHGRVITVLIVDEDPQGTVDSSLGSIVAAHLGWTLSELVDVPIPIALA